MLINIEVVNIFIELVKGNNMILISKIKCFFRYLFFETKIQVIVFIFLKTFFNLKLIFYEKYFQKMKSYLKIFYLIFIEKISYSYLRAYIIWFFDKKYKNNFFFAYLHTSTVKNVKMSLNIYNSSNSFKIL